MLLMLVFAFVLYYLARVRCILLALIFTDDQSVKRHLNLITCSSSFSLAILVLANLVSF
ncbi:hypothetical protein NC651_031532 [Populus alba x Populus x berolinensis]|nr:hypothetical protein NC651_031532 [Populus alba x Populus x berolinensis]